MSYFIEIDTETCTGQPMRQCLATYEGKTAFKSDFERAWIPLQFDFPIDCVKHMRRMYSKRFTLSEDERSILGPNLGPDGNLKSVFYYHITQDVE